MKTSHDEQNTKGEPVENRVRLLLRRHVGAWGYGFAGEISVAERIVGHELAAKMRSLADYATWRESGEGKAPMSASEAHKLAKQIEHILESLPDTGGAKIALSRRRLRAGRTLARIGLAGMAVSSACIYGVGANFADISGIVGSIVFAMWGFGVGLEQSDVLARVETGFVRSESKNQPVADDEDRLFKVDDANPEEVGSMAWAMRND